MEKLRNNKGFTLTELLIAMVILIIGSLGITHLTVSIIRSNSSNFKMTTATLLAQNQVQSVKNLGYTSVDTIAGTENYNSIATYGSYKRVTSVSVNTPAANMKTVTVTVFWDYDRHSVILSTILAE